jgi:hypothetical protein
MKAVEAGDLVCERQERVAWVTFKEGARAFLEKRKPNWQGR